MSVPILPQSLAGAVCAVEGVRGAVALVHGSTGCKFFLSALVEQQDPREWSRSPLAGSVLSLYGQARVPCDDLWGDDLVFGGEARLAAALDVLDVPGGPEVVVVVATTPAAVIGDDVRGVIAARPRRAKAVFVDCGGLLRGAPAGFSRAAGALIETVARADAPKRPGSVNLLGLGINQPRWQDDVAELRRLLGCLGVEVNAVLTAGSTVAEIERSPAATLNVVANADYGVELAVRLRGAFGQPFVGSEVGAPLGLDATDDWLRGIGAALGLPRERVESTIARERGLVEARIVPRLAALDRTDPLNGHTAAVFGEPALTAALSRFLAEYLGLNVVFGGADRSPGAADDLASVGSVLADLQPDLVFGSTYVRAAALAAGIPAGRCVDFGFPLAHRVVLTERPFLGYRGVLGIVEDVLNSRM